MSRKSSINKIKRDNSKSKNIEASLCMYLYLKGHSPISTHVTISQMSECYCISISKSDYIYEYEIKISRADFKKDFTKIKHTNIINENYTKVRKGETFYLLPNYFNFVTPRDLIKLEEVPDYAGLIFMDEDGSFEVMRKPKLLHNTKANTLFIRKVAHNLTCKLIFKKIV